jgi:hypothetical protein
MWAMLDAIGPLPPLATTSKCCGAARRSRHSCIMQHFVSQNVGQRDLASFSCSCANGCFSKEVLLIKPNPSMQFFSHEYRKKLRSFDQGGGSIASFCGLHAKGKNVRLNP